MSHLFAMFGQLRTQAAACGSLSYTAFPADKNPLQ
jgi:hypothetical protein